MEHTRGTTEDLVADGLLKVDEVAAFLRLGKSKVYLLLADGSLPSVKIGGARRIPARALREFAARLLAGAQR